MKGWSCRLESSRPCCCCKAVYHVHHLQLCTGCKSRQLLRAASRSGRVKPQHLLRWSTEETNREPLRMLPGYGTETNAPRCSCPAVSSEQNRAWHSLREQQPQHGQHTLVSCSHFEATGKEAPTGSALCWPLTDRPASPLHATSHYPARFIISLLIALLRYHLRIAPR